MAKKTIIFECQACGNQQSKWVGKCPECGAWDSFVELKAEQIAVLKELSKASKGASSAVCIEKVEIENFQRLATGDIELDLVLGGGLVVGSLVLIGGSPGVGKSTLLLKIAANLARSGKKVLYVSGEESKSQIKLRADRLEANDKNLFLLTELCLEDILEELHKGEFEILIVDSIQTLYSNKVASAAGSLTQVREITFELMRVSKARNISTFIIGHITKDGAIAGPRVLEHMVDVVLYFEGDRHASYRILRGVKNRFGSTNEIGVFEMREEGLVEVENPSEFMLAGRPEGASGSVVACSMEGSRPILIEIQALVCHTNLPMPRRTTAGTDFNRVNLLLAVLEKRAGMQMSSCDVYVNIAGGIRMTEPAIDLGLILALVSSYKDIAIDEKTIAFGEVGLSGEIRSVNMAQQRVQEAKKLGFETVLMPRVSMKALQKTDGIHIVGLETVRDAVQYLMGRR